jgi:hypothetical protein
MPNDTPDPTAIIRELMSQFTGGASSGDGAKPDDLSRMFANAAGATASAQAAFKGVVERALAAANVPGRGELEELAARMGRIEAALFRIEARLGEISSGEPR